MVVECKDGGFSVNRGAEIKENFGQRSSTILRREPPGEILVLDKVGQPNAVQKRQRQTRVSEPRNQLRCRV
jgi:hypothetical protein